MRAVDLVKIAAEAEILRIQHMLKRQGMRAAFGLVAVVFILGVLVLANVAGWVCQEGAKWLHAVR
jgi:hypothetical protein